MTKLSTTKKHALKKLIPTWLWFVAWLPAAISLMAFAVVFIQGASTANEAGGMFFLVVPILFFSTLPGIGFTAIAVLALANLRERYIQLTKIILPVLVFCFFIAAAYLLLNNY